MDVRKYRFTTISYNAPVIQFCSLTKVILKGNIKSASTNFEIARVLQHRCIKRRVTSIEGFRGSGSLVDVSPAVAHVDSRSLVRENFGLNWNCGSDEMKMLS